MLTLYSFGGRNDMDDPAIKYDPTATIDLSSNSAISERAPKDRRGTV